MKRPTDRRAWPREALSRLLTPNPSDDRDVDALCARAAALVHEASGGLGVLIVRMPPAGAPRMVASGLTEALAECLIDPRARDEWMQPRGRAALRPTEGGLAESLLREAGWRWALALGLDFGAKGPGRLVLLATEPESLPGPEELEPLALAVASLPDESGPTLAAREGEAASRLDPATPARPSPDDSAPGKHGPSRRILVVEDDPFTGILMDELLRTWGYTPLLVSDADGALATLDRDPDFAVALIDLHGPRLDGRSLARAIRQRPDINGMRVVAVTGAAPQGRTLDRDLFHAFLRKPVDLETLRGLLPEIPE